jgi:lipooligosaccharide transport system permease protein
MLWWTTRCGISVIGVAVVLLCIPDTRSWGVIFSIPVATACGLAFAVLVGSWTSTREFDNSFSNITRLVITPLFLFGGAFYPVSSLPDAIEPIAYVTPLWHAVELCRDLSLHRAGWLESSIHVSVLAGFIIVGWFGCRRNFTKRLHR